MPNLPVVEPRTSVGRLWLNAPLRRKLLSVVGAMALMWVAPIVVAGVLSVRLDDARSRARVSDADVVAVHDLEIALLRSNTAIEDYLITALEDVEPIERNRAIAATLQADVAALQATLPADLGPALDAAEPAIDAFITAGEAVAEFGAAGTRELDVSTDPALVELDAQLVDALGARLEATAVANEAIEDIEDGVGERAAAARDEVVRYQELLVRATLTSLVVVLVIGTGGGFIVSKGIVRRIERLSDNADRYVRGDPLLPAPASTDEVGELTDKMLFTAGLLDKRRALAVDATRAKDEFLTRVSHELKTPLTAMIGFGQLLEEDRALSPRGRDDAAHIVQAGHQLHGLIEELLDIRAIEAGKLTISTEAIPVWEPADEAITLVQARPECRSIAIAADCPPAVVVAADRRRLRDVLLALMVNAVKNTRPGGRVDLAAVRRPGGTVRITVTDAGPALTPERQQHLFQPLERRRGASDDAQVPGAGLAVTRHLVDAMHGTIGVTSEVGVGTTIWVDLPVDAGTVAAPDAAPSTADPAPSVTDGRSTATSPGRVRVAPSAPRAGSRLRCWWLDLPLGRKLLISSLAPVLLWMPPIVMGVVVNARLDDSRAQTDFIAERSEMLDSVHDSLQTSASSMYLFATLGLTDAELVDESRAASADVPADIAAFRTDLPAGLLPATQDLEETAAAVIASLDTLAALGEERANDPAASADGVTFGSGSPLSAAVGAGLVASFEASGAAEDSIAALDQQLGEVLVEERRDDERLQDLLVRMTLVTMVAALVVAAVGTYVVSNGVVQRIELLSGNADRFIRRERLLPAPDSADEIGRLTDTMHFAGRLLYRRREQAIAATTAKDEFLSRVSHELEAPVRTMIGLAQHLVADTALSPDSRSDAAHIVSAGHHLRELIEELLDIKAIEAGKLAIATEAVSVRATADEVISLVRSMPASSTLIVDADCPPDLVVAADPRRLREVLLNLLSNAVKYNRPGGRVRLAATRRPGERVRISVTDTGPGIAPEAHELVFAPFERLGADETEIEGSGVGLALTRHVVHAMHGTIGLESTLGRGTTFWVDLPAVDGRGARPDDGAADARPATGPMTGTR